jgi:hypothetical protein
VGACPISKPQGIEIQAGAFWHLMANGPGSAPSCKYVIIQKFEKSFRRRTF